MIDKDTAIEVTEELTRRCYPYGDTTVDEQRYESLSVKIAVASSLIDEIYEAGKLYDRHEFSIQRISNRANQYLTELRDMLCEIEYLPLVEDMGEVSDGYHTFNQLYHQRAVLFATIVNQNKDKAWKSWKHEDGQFCFDKGGEWFIVGIDTPKGSYTYHYEKKYWDMFDCEELERGKQWDGHTEDDVTRLLSLPPVEPKPVCEDAISKHDLWRIIEDNAYWVTYNETSKEKGMTLTGINQALNECPPAEQQRPKGEWIIHPLLDAGRVELECPECGNTFIRSVGCRPHFCEYCGARMKGAEDDR